MISLVIHSSLIVDDETLKKEVDDLTCALGKAYGGESHFLKCLGSQRFPVYKEGLVMFLRKTRMPTIATSASIRDTWKKSARTTFPVFV